MKNISLIDLKRQYATIREEADAKILEVLHSAQYIMGDNVKNFEKEFAEYIGVKHAVSVGNGTDALIIALKALGIGEGDEVITTPFTFFATAESISYVNATPVFVDVDPDTYNMDVTKLEEAIGPRTKAIMPVHIFGNPCDMDAINAIAEKHGLFVIEDAAQAAGAVYKGKRIGSLSTIACFSFFPTKNLGCAGDGGMIVTDDENLAVIVQALRSHGSGDNGKRARSVLTGEEEEISKEVEGDNTVYNPSKYYNYIIGQNSRLDEVQAALLRVKLKQLDAWNDKRIHHAQQYNKGLEGSDLVTPAHSQDTKHIYHLYIIQSEKREALVEHLKEKGIATGVYYPVPMHLQKVYGSLGYKEGDFSNAEYLSHRTMALPMFAELTEEEADYILACVKEFK